MGNSSNNSHPTSRMCIMSPEITLYFSKHHEITLEDGCLLWGIQAIIPTQLRKCVLFKLRQRYSHNPTEMQKLSEVTVGTRMHFLFHSFMLGVQFFVFISFVHVIFICLSYIFCSCMIYFVSCLSLVKGRYLVVSGFIFWVYWSHLPCKFPCLFHFVVFQYFSPWTL